MDFEDESTWLRHRVLRLRTILRYVKDARAESGLRELIAEAEQRLEQLEATEHESVNDGQRELMPRQRQNESPSTAGAYSTHNSTPTQRNAHISANCPASIKETLRLSIGFVVAAVKQKAPVSRRGAS